MALIDDLKALRTKLITELNALEAKLDADTTEPINPLTHHAYNMIATGRRDELRLILYGGKLSTNTSVTIAEDKCLNSLIVANDTNKWTATYNIPSGFGGNATAPSAQSCPEYGSIVIADVPNSIVAPPSHELKVAQDRVSELTAAGASAAEIAEANAIVALARRFVVTGWCTKQPDTTKTEPPMDLGDIYYPGQRVYLTKNITLYPAYGYGPTDTTGWTPSPASL